MSKIIDYCGCVYSNGFGFWTRQLLKPCTYHKKLLGKELANV